MSVSSPASHARSAVSATSARRQPGAAARATEFPAASLRPPIPQAAQPPSSAAQTGNPIAARAGGASPTPDLRKQVLKGDNGGARAPAGGETPAPIDCDVQSAVLEAMRALGAPQRRGDSRGGKGAQLLWTPAHDALLRRWRALGGGVAPFARAWGISDATVTWRIGALGLSRRAVAPAGACDGREGGVRGRGREWTARELAVLARALSGGASHAVIAGLLGRTERSVVMRIAADQDRERRQQDRQAARGEHDKIRPDVARRCLECRAPFVSVQGANWLCETHRRQSNPFGRHLA